MNRTVDHWEEVIAKKGIDVNASLSYITAKEVKEISHKEPRLMAKMDTMEDMPKIFRENGLFLLPVSRTKYALVKGDGFHSLEASSKPVVHSTQFRFPTSVEGVRSEGAFLDYALSSGVLERFTKSERLYLVARGRRTTPSFKFDFYRTEVEVDRAQLELDGGYESLTGESMISVEAKIGLPSSFNIRQLYYPFRTFGQTKPVRNVFFVYEPGSMSYLFWEYEFVPESRYEGIRLARQGAYEVKVEDAISVKTFKNVQSTIDQVPQADSVDKIMAFPFRVAEGFDTSEKIKKAFGFTVRQSSYYRQAAEILGLVVMSHNNKYFLTEEGERYIRLPTEERIKQMCKMLLGYRLMSEIWATLTVDSKAMMSKHEIAALVKRRSGLGGTTPPRRAQTIIAWFRWIQNNLGIVEVDSSGNIGATSGSRLRSAH
jgi:hypothetical protein